MRLTSVVLALMMALGSAFATERSDIHQASGTLINEKEILLPSNYRSWVALAPAAAGVPEQSHSRLVSRIFVEPTSYEAFSKSGIWPERSVIVLELRDKSVRPSRHRVVGLEVAAKSGSNLTDPWTYYGIIFDKSKPAEDLCPEAGPSSSDMRLSMFFPALRAVIEAKPREMQPAVF